MNTTTSLVGLSLGAGALLLAGCGTPAHGRATTPVVHVDGLTVPLAHPDPADFTTQVDNPWFPLTPGTQYVYAVTEGADRSTETVTVTRRTTVVGGVRCIVVLDIVRGADGQLEEDTQDWYAQDRAGNVWYFGEHTTAYSKGRGSTKGSWRTGSHGGQPGVQMLAKPDVGDAYPQEYLRGTAEDRGKVIASDGRATVPAGTYTSVLVTKDTTPLEPDVVEHKFYARGVGTVMEQDISGGHEVVRLVSVTHQ